MRNKNNGWVWAIENGVLIKVESELNNKHSTAARKKIIGGQKSTMRKLPS